MFTIGRQLEVTGGRPTGFDYLRISLAIAITAWHTLLISYGLDGVIWGWTGSLRPVTYILVPSFFALSGFLVAGSLLRNDIVSFLTLRALRIVPALFCEIIISAFIIGPLFTELPLHVYFASPQLWVYLQNIIGLVHFDLPGVFTHDNVSFVNRQLWTIPYEFECYVAISVLAVCGIVRRTWLFVWFFALATVAIFLILAVRSHFPPLASLPSAKLCILSFLAGVLLFLARDRIPYNRTLCLVALVTSWITLDYTESGYFSALPLAYLTVWLGLQNPRKPAVMAADYSYGVYLYGFPLQQVAYELGFRSWYANLLAGLALAFAAAYLSWTLVESRVLNRRKQILALVNNTRQTLSRATGFRRLARAPGADA
jgi:peptidoglycan/LPS O-acetylase OafA/YrhL